MNKLNETIVQIEKWSNTMKETLPRCIPDRLITMNTESLNNLSTEIQQLVES